ncbi:MAG: Xylose isomerase domain protein barrel [Marmoricola sp.]|nr:Xylose isomerase domain protein barrel [Marmoricola sp.]
MLAVAEQHGVRILEVEYLTAWGTAADRDEAQQKKEQTVFHMARAFGVHHLNAGLLEKLPLDVMTDAFAALCERAGPDLTVALEFMPTTASRPRHGLADRGGVPNATLIIDNRRRARAGQKPADLDEVPAERNVSVQLCDVRAEPMKPLRAESLAHRLAPGQGYGDTVGWCARWRHTASPPAVMAVEVISDELVARGVDVAAQVTADAAREVLGRAGIA